MQSSRGMLQSRIDHDDRLGLSTQAATVKSSGVPAMPPMSRTVQVKSTATPPHGRQHARRAPAPTTISAAWFTVRTSCTGSTSYRTDYTRCAGAIPRAVPRPVQREFARQ